jgi:hypothetical protein
MRSIVSFSLFAALLVACSDAPPQTSGPSCTTPAASDGHEPPCNPALADSPWASSHRGSFAQASSPFPAPVPGQAVATQHVAVMGVPIVVDFTAPYPDGGRAVWMSVVNSPDNGGVYKVDFATGAVIDAQFSPSGRPGSITGAYNLLDRDGRLVVGRETAIDVFGDATPGDRLSKIARLARFELPRRALCRPDDKLVGLGMTFDGWIAFATEQGVVGVVPREPERMSDGALRTLSLNGDACASDAPLELVSNSIAVDERGGIYVVTSGALYRVQWDGDALGLGWRVEYESETAGGVRLGEGSGSTPTVMGTAPGDDRFVVITDGRKLMHLVLVWRDDVPADFEPLAPGKDPRIACEVPVRFGDPDATESNSEQSVLVRGYASVVVNNKLADEAELAALPPDERRIRAALDGGNPLFAPHGLERIDWDPRTRTCHSVWANREVSIPNGIPTMSTATGLVYGIGQRDGVWGLEGLDFATGESVLRVPTSSENAHNSFYAATTVGPEATIWTGTLGGIDVFR